MIPAVVTNGANARIVSEGSERSRRHLLAAEIAQRFRLRAAQDIVEASAAVADRRFAAPGTALVLTGLGIGSDPLLVGVAHVGSEERVLEALGSRWSPVRIPL